MDVADWLARLGLERYAAQFVANDITFDLLPKLTAEDLTEIGVSSVGHRRRLLDAIGELQKGDMAAADPVTGERRQVTVLFADLTGYTEFSRLLDAEEIERILAAFFEVADAAIVENGGNIDKHIGDCVMAVFGAPVAYGNDAERAVRAAIRIRDSIPALCQRVGREIGVHVGIASGEVLASRVGSARHRAYTVTGESVNLASRLTDHAASGEILLSPAVYRALSHRLDCEAVGDIDVKGFATPVTAWRLFGLRQEPVGSRTFVGRAAELDRFKDVASACRERAQGRVVYVRGEAGLGKTRLVEQFQQIADLLGFACHSGLVLDFGAGSDRDAVRTIIRSIVTGGHSDRSEIDAGRIARLVDEGRVREDHAVFLHDLLNVGAPVELRALYDAMDSATRNRGALATITEIVASAAAASPLMIGIEDLHWADASLLAQISAVMEAAAHRPVLIVLTSRPAGDPRLRGWDLPDSTLTIDLAPLPQDEALALASRLLNDMNPFVVSCVERAAGNPLFLEQLLQTPAEQGGRTVPDSVQSLVQARLDRLPAADKQALQAASVFGQRFSLAALQALIETPAYSPATLVDHAFVRPFESEFLFGHALIRDAIYATLLRSRQRELHGRAASWFAGRDLALHAQHLDRADDPRAPQAYLAAAREQAAHYRFKQALALLQRGAALAADQAGDRFSLTCTRGELLHDMGEVSDARDAFEQALAQSDDDASRCRAWLGLAAVKRITDDLPGALADVEKAERVADRLCLRDEAARAHFLHGNLLFPRGDMEGCLREHRRSLELARQAGSAEHEAAALGGLGDAEYARGRMLSARAHFGKCIELARRHGFGRIEVANLPMYAFMRLFGSETREALDDAMAAIDMARKVGHLRAEMIAHHAAYNAHHLRGEYAEARAHTIAALALARQLRARRFEAEALAFGAELDRLDGRTSDAEIAIREALAISEETGMAYFGPIYYGIQALIAEDEAERRAALANGEALLAGNALGHNHLLFRGDAIEACMMLRDWNEAERHAAALEEFVRLEPLPLSAFLAARAHAFAAFARGRRDAELDQRLQQLRLEADRTGIRLPDVEAFT